MIKNIINIKINFSSSKKFISFATNNIKQKTIKKFKEHNELTPSIKLYPFIKTKKKNDINKTLRKSISSNEFR